MISKDQSIKFAELTNKFDKAIFIVGHMIGFEEISVKSKNKNVYYDISAPYLIPYSIFKGAINKVGSERFILGSDTPYGKQNLKINIDRIRKLQLTHKEESNSLELKSLITSYGVDTNVNTGYGLCRTNVLCESQNPLI